MRLLAWNCCSGPLGTKLSVLGTLEADLAVIPECPRLPREPGSTVWFGTNRHKGLGVIARPPWRIARVSPAPRLPRWVRPVQVTGPRSFLLWAVWACPGPHRYVRGIHRALKQSFHLFDSGPNVMLGDFNSHSLWDRNYPADENHTALIRRLVDLGLISSYHAYFAEPHGSESRPTFYEYRHRDRPYHIDYCFLPAAWAAAIDSVTVGSHAEWAPRSDHMPLVTTLGPTD